MDTLSHIRKPNRQQFRSSSSGYVRRGTRPEPETLCGAPVTDRDLTMRQREMVECGECRFRAFAVVVA